MTITFMNLGTGESLEIKCKKWYPTENGIIYITFLNEWKYDFEEYKVNTDWTFWSVK